MKVLTEKQIQNRTFWSRIAVIPPVTLLGRWLIPDVPWWFALLVMLIAQIGAHQTFLAWYGDRLSKNPDHVEHHCVRWIMHRTHRCRCGIKWVIME